LALNPVAVKAMMGTGELAASVPFAGKGATPVNSTESPPPPQAATNRAAPTATAKSLNCFIFELQVKKYDRAKST
jgi:hypothetical protein